MNNKRNNTLILDNVPANVNINDFTNQLDEEVLDNPKRNEDDIKDLRNNAKNLSIGSDKENKFQD